MPSPQLGEGAFEKPFGSCFVFGVLVDVQYGRCVNGQLDDTRGLAVAWGIGAALGVPELQAREVLAEEGLNTICGRSPLFHWLSNRWKSSSRRVPDRSDCSRWR